MKKTPPLNALRTFAAVVQAGKISSASRETGVSSSAISQQIRNLENWLGIALFERKGRDLILTDRGQQYFDEIAHALNIIASATGQIVGDDTVKSLIRLSILPSFLLRWLLPRLDDFTSRFPHIEIDFISSTSLSSFHVDDVDLAIRFGNGNYPGLDVQPFLHEAVAPVCHPDLINTLLKKASDTLSVEDLVKLPAINDESSLKGDKLTLKDWFEFQGMQQVHLNEPLRFSDSHIACEAARQRKGLLMGRASLVSDWLEQGELIAPINQWVPDKAAYFLVSSKLRPMRPQVKLFRDWIKNTAQEWLAQPQQKKMFPSHP